VGRRSIWNTRLIKGGPIPVGRRELIPVVKMRSMFRRQVTFGTQSSSGGGGGVVWLQPVAVVVREPDGREERIAVSDATWITVQRILMGALTLPILYLTIATAASVWRSKCQRANTSGGNA